MAQLMHPGRVARRTRVLPLLLVAGVVLNSPLTAQHPLPADMVAGFHQSFADQITLPVNPGVGTVQVKLTFDNAGDAKQVTATYAFQAAGAKRMVERRDYKDLAFKPTALCRAKPRGDTFFVIGWAERSGQVVIEQWTLAQYALGTTTTPGGAEVSVLAPPSIQKELIFAGGGLAPILGAAYDPFAGKLYLLERSPQRAIRVLDVPTGELAETPAVTELTHPALASHRSLSIGLSSTAGLVIYSQPRARWQKPTDFEEPYIQVVMKDANVDGVTDSIIEQPAADLVATTAGTWVAEYP